MLDTIFTALLGIWDILQMLFSAVAGFFVSGIQLLGYLGHAMNWLPFYWSTMPHLWTMVFPSLIGIVIVYKFLNRA